MACSRYVNIGESFVGIMARRSLDILDFRWISELHPLSFLFPLNLCSHPCSQKYCIYAVKLCRQTKCWIDSHEILQLWTIGPHRLILDQAVRYKPVTIPNSTNMDKRVKTGTTMCWVTNYLKKIITQTCANDTSIYLFLYIYLCVRFSLSFAVLLLPAVLHTNKVTVK